VVEGAREDLARWVLEDLRVALAADISPAQIMLAGARIVAIGTRQGDTTVAATITTAAAAAAAAGAVGA